MAKITPQNIFNDLDFKEKYDQAKSLPDFAARESALLALRESYLEQSYQIEAAREQIQDDYTRNILIQNLLSLPDDTSCQQEITGMQARADGLLADYKQHKRRATLSRFTDTKQDIFCVTTLPQKMADTLNKAMLGHYDPEKSVLDNRRDAETFIQHKRRMLEKQQRKAGAQPL